MIYYLSFLNSNAFKKNPIKILIRAITLSLLILFKKKKIIKYNFGKKNIKFLFLPLKKFMGGRGIFLYREEIEPLLNYGYKFVNVGDTVLDGGANQGIYTLSFSKKVGKNGKVISFEPFEYCVSQIKYNSKLNNLSNIKIINKCLYNKNTNLKIDYSDGIGSASIVKNFGNQKKEVQTITIDTVKKKLNLNKIKLIKLDIEGAELNALMGAKNVLKYDKPILSVECEPKEFIQINKFLSKYNYNSYLLNENGDLIQISKIKKKEPCVIFVSSVMKFKLNMFKK